MHIAILFILFLINLVMIFIINKYFNDFRRNLMSNKFQIIENGLRHGRRTFTVDTKAEATTILKEFENKRNWRVEVLEEGGKKIVKFQEKGERKILKG